VGTTRSAYKGFKTPAVGIDAAVKILQDLGTSRWQLRIVFFTPAPVHPKGAPNEYDNGGNVAQKTTDGTTTTYVYDYANRLTALGVLGTTTTYGYDAFGNGVWQATGWRWSGRAASLKNSMHSRSFRGSSDRVRKDGKNPAGLLRADRIRLTFFAAREAGYAE